MKLILAGSTGFVATEVIRQAIRNPAVASIVALTRREIAAPPDAGADASKLKSVICNDFSNYSDEVKKDLAGADACIWLLAVTPSKARAMPFDDVRKICYDYTVTGIETMSPIAAKPFRFIYTSGVAAERDPTKKPFLMGDYSLLRGKTEQMVLDYAKASKGAVEASITKPGLIDAIDAPMATTVFRAVLRTVVGLPRVHVSGIAAALIKQAVNGIEKETLLNEDLVEIGGKVLEEQKASSS